MAKVFLYDISKCSGCHNCQLACKDEHCGADWPPYAAAQPDIGQFWMKVDEHVRGTTPKVFINYVPHACNHCADASCMAAAKNDAVYRRDDGLVIIDPAKAKGQRQLVDSCPYDAIYYNKDLGLPQKCTGCAHLLDDGWEVPRCVDSCHTQALRYVDEDDPALTEAIVLKPETGNGPRAYYLNYPKRFVAGEVYDSEADEVIIGASVTLTDASGAALDAATDDFGDFWFRQIEPQVYQLTFTANGYLQRTLAVDASEKDVNVGGVALYAVS